MAGKVPKPWDGLSVKERIEKAGVLRRKVAALGVCLVCGIDTDYQNGFCGPCWNLNENVIVKQDPLG